MLIWVCSRAWSAACLAWVGTMVVNQFISGGIHLGMTPSLLVLGIGLSVIMGTLGAFTPPGVPPGSIPMDAIRLGSH